jgi:hypothetical protein
LPFLKQYRIKEGRFNKATFKQNSKRQNTSGRADYKNNCDIILMFALPLTLRQVNKQGGMHPRVDKTSGKSNTKIPKTISFAVLYYHSQKSRQG